jgi:hypothetical protein
MMMMMMMMMILAKLNCWAVVLRAQTCIELSLPLPLTPRFDY